MTSDIRAIGEALTAEAVSVGLLRAARHEALLARQREVEMAADRTRAWLFAACGWVVALAADPHWAAGCAVAVVAALLVRGIFGMIGSARARSRADVTALRARGCL